MNRWSSLPVLVRLKPRPLDRISIRDSNRFLAVDSIVLLASKYVRRKYWILFFFWQNWKSEDHSFHSIGLKYWNLILKEYKLQDISVSENWIQDLYVLRIVRLFAIEIYDISREACFWLSWLFVRNTVSFCHLLRSNLRIWKLLSEKRNCANIRLHFSTLISFTYRHVQTQYIYRNHYFLISSLKRETAIDLHCPVSARTSYIEI